MAYKVEFRPAAAKALRKLPEDVRTRIAKAIDVLRDDPRHAGVHRLRGGRNEYRARVGDYRILYEVDDAVLIVLVLHVGHRREIYR
ncbi:MAG TPA: type II toxin-antitoxin system RelE/ParE family toxin [Candidatus Paceibacterota bacterium]|nr:type II toxin-antitoxin system RelE/ParE family toxin [Candidatus Paceibacterota bacterium]